VLARVRTTSLCSRRERGRCERKFKKQRWREGRFFDDYVAGLIVSVWLITHELTEQSMDQTESLSSWKSLYSMFADLLFGDICRNIKLLCHKLECQLLYFNNMKNQQLLKNKRNRITRPALFAIVFKSHSFSNRLTIFESTAK
jgi:hypothetical protein